MAQKTGAPIRQSLAKQMPMCDWPSLSASWVSLTPFLCLFPGPRDALTLPSSGFSSHPGDSENGVDSEIPIRTVEWRHWHPAGEGFCLFSASRPVPAVS